MTRRLTAAHLLTGRTGVTGFAPAELTLGEAGDILTLRSMREPPAGVETSLAPAFFDVHIHGAMGYDVMSASTAELSVLQRFLATRGVAHYLPTTVTAALDTTLYALEGLADAIERGPQPLQAQPVGIHLEGPFLSHTKRGVHPAAYLLAPSIPLLERLQKAARGHIALLTLAPELPGALDLIAFATAHGIRVSLGHTNATAAETVAAIAAGATSATHTFNAMRAMDHREPGILGTTLDDDRLYAELICDGIHVLPPLVRLWLRAKGPGRAILVTDAMPATGCGDGAYTLGGLPVTVTNGRSLLTGDLAEGREVLAGSVLTMDTAVANLQQVTGCSLADAIVSATQTPAAMLGRPDLTELAPGRPANLNRFDANGRLLATYLRGEQVPPMK